MERDRETERGRGEWVGSEVGEGACVPLLLSSLPPSPPSPSLSPLCGTCGERGKI
jgi:hypothetical protein